jgi:hypothetical protein
MPGAARSRLRTRMFCVFICFGGDLPTQPKPRFNFQRRSLCKEAATFSWPSMRRLPATTISSSESTVCIRPSNTILSFSDGCARHTGHVLSVPTLIQDTRHWK